MLPSIQQHCAEIERCNQRGGRMLSIFDLLEARTLDLDLAAYLMAEVARGASFMVGARPGGAGKTTVMGALLNLLPSDVPLAAATAEAARAARRERAKGRRCYICHEIGRGSYFAYLWGGALRNYCALQDAGHILATNLHADDLDEAHDQVCGDSGVPESHFNGFRLLVFLRVKGGHWNAQRHIEKVYAADGSGPHRCVFTARNGLATPHLIDTAWLASCRRFLEAHYEDGVRTIEQTRERVVAFLAESGE